MIYLFSVAAGLVGGFAAVLLLSGRRPRRRKEGKQNRRKTECSKLVLWAVLCTYFAGFGVGVWAVVLDASQLGVFLAYVGTPTATVIGFYSWKAKAENVVKIKKANPEEIPGGRKTVKSKNGENLVFSKGGVTKVTPFPFSSAHSGG